jgi:hypothetical protein
MGYHRVICKAECDGSDEAKQPVRMAGIGRIWFHDAKTQIVSHGRD